MTIKNEVVINGVVLDDLLDNKTSQNRNVSDCEVFWKGLNHLDQLLDHLDSSGSKFIQFGI